MGKMKYLVLLVVIVVLVINLISFLLKDDKSSTNIKSTSIPDYQIVQIEDVSFGNTKRYSVNVITKTLDYEAIKQVGIAVVEKYKQEKSFNAISVFINDHVEFVGHGYSLGRVIYAPNGEWGKAMEVNTGEYSKMQYQFDIKNKQSENQLTDEEANIIKQWNDTQAKLNHPLDEQLTIDSVAMQNGISPDQVQSIMRKFIMWMM